MIMLWSVLALLYITEGDDKLEKNRGLDSTPDGDISFYNCRMGMRADYFHHGRLHDHGSVGSSSTVGASDRHRQATREILGANAVRVLDL